MVAIHKKIEVYWICTAIALNQSTESADLASRARRFLEYQNEGPGRFCIHMSYLPTCASILVVQHPCQVSFKSMQGCRM